MELRRPANYSYYLIYSFFFLVSLNIDSSLAAIEENTTIPVNVGVVMDGLDSKGGKVRLSCIRMALSDFYNASRTSSKTKLVLRIRDSNNDVIDAAAAALDLIKNVQVQAILGPTSSMQANFVIDLGGKAQVPIISFSATSPSLTSIPTSYFLRAAQNDSSQVKAISAIIQAFGWREAVPIYVANEFGEEILASLVDALHQVKASVPYRSAIHPEASDDQIEAELYKLMTMQTRVFIVHTSSSLGFRIFSKAQEIRMINEGYVWIMTNGLTNVLSSANASIINSMQGALGVRTYVPKTEELVDFRIRWKRQFQVENPTIIDAELDIFALWAYDAAFALAMAVENISDTINFGYVNTNVSNNSQSTDLLTLGVSQSGQKLFQSLSSTKFKGLSGDFIFMNGEIQSSVFEIVNVIGDGAREIGFWTPESGLLQKSMNPTNTSSVTLYSTSKSNMGPIIWPGDSAAVPKGWEIPTNTKKLRIGVPVKIGSPEFVKVVRDPSTNATVVTGFCIDIFNAVTDKLPYALIYDFIPFAKPDGTTAGTYNDLVDQVYLGNFDGVAAATTIRANRSLYVDFTLPYTESVVVMVVLAKDSKSQNVWMFLKPLTRNLWITSSCFFVFMAIVIRALDHANEDFHGSFLYQTGTALWFSFQTLVFAQREVISNLARVVVLVWLFFVLILTQSYTASLISMLAIPNLQPSFPDLKALINNEESVGYPKGSFIYQLLLNEGFDDSKIKAYKTPEECDELLTKGTANGGIAAAVDETPNLRAFLAKYCSNKYMTVGPIFKTNGYAFVFPKGSPLVADVSRAILNVTEGDEMKEIESKWFGKQASCPDTNSPFSNHPNSLDLNTLGGLFIMVGVASAIAIIICVGDFFYAHRNDEVLTTPGTPIWKKIAIMVNTFVQEDLVPPDHVNRA